MGHVIASASMSLDGYIAKEDNTIGRLFDWLQNGTVDFPTVNPDMTFHLSPASAEYWHGWVDGLGALVCGRTLFDFTGGWDGTHTMDVPVVVVTHQVPADWVAAHPDAPFHFVTDGVEAALAKAQQIAGDRTVAVTAGTIAGQCLELGLLDKVAVDLVPVVMGHGRPFFGELAMDDVPLGDPEVNIQGDRVTHLVFPGDRVPVMRTLHVGLRVHDLQRSLRFYEGLGYEVIGTVPRTGFGSLTMLQLPDDEFVGIELVHDADAGPVDQGGFHHLVVHAPELRETVARLAAHGIEAEEPSSPDGSEEFLTSWLTDPDGYRIELVQWPADHPDGMTRADLEP